MDAGDRASDEAKLREQIEKSSIEWRLTFDAIESPILILSMHGNVVRMNRAARNIARRSYTYNESFSQQVSSIGRGAPWQQAADMVETVGRTRSGVTCQAKNDETGKTWDIEASLMIGDGVTERVIVVARDVTATVALQDDLRRSEAMSAMGSLVAGVAHEVRNPLFAISATLDAFVARFAQGDEHEPFVVVLRRELERVGSLMEELLEYGRPSSVRLIVQPSGAIIAQAVKVCSPLAEQRGVSIDNQVVADFGVVQADQRRMLQVFKNLLENAIQHSPEGGVVVVEARESAREGSWVHCAVRDEGAGFRPEDLPRVFEPFFTRRRGGTGLGLSIVRRVVEEHGGKVTASNHPEGGALVTVALPLFGEH